MKPMDQTSIPAGRVNITIDRLAIGGLDTVARNAFVDGLRTQLTSLLGNPATLASLSSGSDSSRVPVLRIGRVSLQPGNSGAHHLGVQVARAIAASGSARGARRRVRP